MTLEDRNIKLQRLATYLHKLPNSLAVKSSKDSRYDFQGFEPDPEWVDNIGTVEGAVNRELECRLGSRANGPVEFTERGAPVEALVGVLDRYTKEFPNDLLLARWVDDAIAGAIHTFSKLQTPVRVLSVLNSRVFYVFAPVAPRLECCQK